MSKDCIIPRFNVFCDKIKDIYDETIKHEDGNNANYIPQLSRVNSDQYGISICTIDGQRYNIGDTDKDFTIQSCCKPINYGIALETNSDLGEKNVECMLKVW